MCHRIKVDAKGGPGDECHVLLAEQVFVGRVDACAALDLSVRVFLRQVLWTMGFRMTFGQTQMDITAAGRVCVSCQESMLVCGEEWKSIHRLYALVDAGKVAVRQSAIVAILQQIAHIRSNHSAVKRSRPRGDKFFRKVRVVRENGGRD